MGAGGEEEGGREELDMSQLCFIANANIAQERCMGTTHVCKRAVQLKTRF